MNLDNKIAILRKWAMEYLEQDHNIEDILLIKGRDDIEGIIAGYIILDSSMYLEHELDLNQVMVFRFKDKELDGNYLFTTYHPDSFAKIKDKTNGGRLEILGSLI